MMDQHLLEKIADMRPVFVPVMSTRRRCLWRTVCLTEPNVSQRVTLWPDILSAVKAFCVAAHCQRCASVKHKGFLCHLMTGRLALPTASEDLLAGASLDWLAGWLPLGRPLESIHPCVCCWCFFGNTECLGAGGGSPSFCPVK